MEYTIRVKLEHEEVMGLCLLKLRRKERLVSCSAETIKLWSPELTQVCSKTLLAAPSSFVGPVGWIHGGGFAQGQVLCAGNDFRLRKWDLAKTVERPSLLHSSVVRAFAVDSLETVTCAGRNILRWKDDKVVETIIADDESDVEAVIKLPDGSLVSGAGHTIKVWKVENGSTTSTLAGTHEADVTRLCVNPRGGFISSSRDGLIRSWTGSGNSFDECVGHTAAVVSVDANADGLILSGSVDFCAKLWKDGNCILTLKHPDEVCDVKFLRNGDDVATACRDGYVRVWTPKTTGGSSDEGADTVMDYAKQSCTLEDEINYLMKEGVAEKIKYSMSILIKEKENLRRAVKNSIASGSKKKSKPRLKWNSEMESALTHLLNGKDVEKIDDEVPSICRTMCETFPQLSNPKPVKRRVADWKIKQGELNK